MTERFQQFKNEGHSSKPSPNLSLTSLTSSTSPNPHRFNVQKTFLSSRDFHGIFTGNFIYILFLVKILWFSRDPRNLKGLPKLVPFGLYELVRQRLGLGFDECPPLNCRSISVIATHENSRPVLIPDTLNILEHFDLQNPKQNKYQPLFDKHFYFSPTPHKSPQSAVFNEKH